MGLAISWILHSWKGVNLQALVCMCSWPRLLFTMQTSLMHSVRGVIFLLSTSWKISAPQESQVYALTWRSGLTSETRVTIPRTVMSLPR